MEITGVTYSRIDRDLFFGVFLDSKVHDDPCKGFMQINNCADQGGARPRWQTGTNDTFGNTDRKFGFVQKDGAHENKFLCLKFIDNETEQTDKEDQSNSDIGEEFGNNVNNTDVDNLNTGSSRYQRQGLN